MPRFELCRFFDLRSPHDNDHRTSHNVDDGWNVSLAGQQRDQRRYAMRGGDMQRDGGWGLGVLQRRRAWGPGQVPAQQARHVCCPYVQR